jgi:HAMP domain-containing protein
MDADIEKYLRNIRDTEMPAMGNALGLLGGIEFTQQQTLVPEHAAHLYSTARTSLVMQRVLLTGALELAFGAMVIVTRRAIKPLHTMRDAMLKVAAGDLQVDIGYAARHDEIGALAGAIETFKQQAADKARIEAQERERNVGAMARQQAIESYVGEFEGMVRGRDRDCRRSASARRRHPGDHALDAICGAGHQERVDNITGVKADADAAAAAEDVKQASQTLETQSQQLGNQATTFLGKIRAA